MIKNEKIASIVNYAIKYNPLYQNINGSTAINSRIDFAKLNIIDKSTLREYAQYALSETYTKYPLVDKLQITSTSGSTGECMKVYWDKDDYFLSAMSAVLFRKKHYGISPDSHYISFFSTLYSNNKIEDDVSYKYDSKGNHLIINKSFLSKLYTIENESESKRSFDISFIYF